jgi:hypothetical protein
MHGGSTVRTALHRHRHNQLHSHAEAQKAIRGGHRRAAGMSTLAPSRHHMHAAEPPTRVDRSYRPPSCFRKTPATRVRRTSQVLCRSESLAKRMRRGWMGEHGMVAGMGWRAPKQFYDDVGARGRRCDRPSASDAHACDVPRCTQCQTGNWSVTLSTELECPVQGRFLLVASTGVPSVTRLPGTGHWPVPSASP